MHMFLLFRTAQPICLAELLHYFEPESRMPAEHAYVYATGVVLGSAFQVIIIHSYVFNYFYVSMNAKAALRSLIYKKAIYINTLFSMLYSYITYINKQFWRFHTFSA